MIGGDAMKMTLEVFMKTAKDRWTTITKGWTMCAFGMAEGTIWAFRFAFFGN